MKNILPKLLAVIWLIVFFAFSSKSQSQFMRSNLYVMNNGSRILIDGNLTQYNAIYSNNVDMFDVWKMQNTGENFGILRQGQNLVMERRQPVSANDTTYFRLWNLQQQTYQMEVITLSMPYQTLRADVFDKFTGHFISINLNDTTRFNFIVNNNPASYDQNRFKLIYSSQSFAALPVSFTSFYTKKQKDGIQLTWTVASETDAITYKVERSADGFNYNTIKELRAVNAGAFEQYSVMDYSPLKGQNYYRIKVITTAAPKVSSISKVLFAENFDPSFVIQPNPVSAKNLTFQLYAETAGMYTLSVIDAVGETVYRNQNILFNNSNNFSIQLPMNIQPGIYTVLIAGPTGFRKTQRAIIL